MVRHLPGFREGGIIFQVVGDAGGPHRVIADAGCDARPFSMALYQPVGVLLRQPVRYAGRAARGAKQRPVRVGRDAYSGDVFIEVRFQFRDAGRFVFLAALFVRVFGGICGLLGASRAGLCPFEHTA